MPKVYSIGTPEKTLLDNVSGIAKNRFIEQISSEDFSIGYAVSVSNMDGKTLIVTDNHVLVVNPVEAE
jgi:hypothetical protein